MSVNRPVVIKLGGSLLTLQGLAQRLNEVFRLWSGQRAILVVGGGPVTQFVLEMSRLHECSAAGEHWQAVRSLVHNSYLLSCCVPNTEVAPSLDHCNEIWSRGSVPILDTFQFLMDQEAQKRVIPREREFTSDSIAALVAEVSGAERLWMLKSVQLPPGSTVRDLVQQGLVDRYFPQHITKLNEVRWVNLRASKLRLESVHLTIE